MASLHYTSTLFASHAPRCTVLLHTAVLPLDRGSISHKYRLTASLIVRSDDREPDGMLALHKHAYRIARTTLHCAAVYSYVVSRLGDHQHTHRLASSLIVRSDDREPDGTLALHKHALFCIAHATLHCAAVYSCVASLIALFYLMNTSHSSTIQHTRDERCCHELCRLRAGRAGQRTMLLAACAACCCLLLA